MVRHSGVESDAHCTVGWLGKPPLPTVTLLGGAVGMRPVADSRVVAGMGAESDFFPSRSSTQAATYRRGGAWWELGRAQTG